ncbi:RNA-directed DNA polymerase, partial [Thiolapillus sp.]|uniref:RNA-directed DNA polymerase n=1 Tax=Thiolapillus sp. TaxID=2017437 RepID=UPI003AF6DE63
PAKPSNLPFVSKLIEKLVLDQLFRHLDHNNLWHTFQSAYRPKHSTETALLRVLNDLLTASDSGSISILTLLDLSAAFDTIDHSILLTRLDSTFGIRDLALSFFRSYLQDRTQVVTVNGIKSSPSLLTCGVPQGSVLGPILFILYTQPLSDVISHHSVSHHMFADDTELYKSDSPSEAFTLSRTIEACISDVKVWVVQNKLQLNDDKTEILLIGSAPGIDLPSSVRVGQSDISFSSAARNLGVIFDSELALKEQVNKLCQLAYLEIRRIGSIRQYLSVEATKTLVSSLVLSRLDYCNALLAGCPQVLLDKIQRVINCSARLIYKASKSAHITPLLFDLHWLPISSRIQYKIALTCFHIISGTAPPYLSELL